MKSKMLLNYLFKRIGPAREFPDYKILYIHTACYVCYWQQNTFKRHLIILYVFTCNGEIRIRFIQILRFEIYFQSKKIHVFMRPWPCVYLLN